MKSSNNVMDRTHLIQRLVKPKHWNVKGTLIDNPFSFGGGLKNGGISDEAMSVIREIFSFDYMGSAEFEWGAVPKALALLAKQAGKNNLVSGEIKIDERGIVYYITPSEYKAEVINRITLLANKDSPFYLKERCGLYESLDPNYEYSKYEGWLELDNGFMFFIDKEMYQKTCELFGIKI